MKKVLADFLIHTKTVIEVDMTKNLITMTYKISLTNFRNAVNNKHATSTPTHCQRRNIQYVDQRERGRARGSGLSGQFRGRGCGGRGTGRIPHTTQSGLKRERNDSTFITLTDGQVVEFHPSIKFSDNIFRQMKIEDKQALQDARSAYRCSRTVNQMQLFYLNSTCTPIVPWNARGAYTHQYSHNHASTISQMTTNTPQ